MSLYCRPSTISDALAALADAGSDGRLLLGGTDLLVRARHDPAVATVFIDLKHAEDLPPPIQITGDTVRFGATARMGAISAHPVILERMPALASAARVVGSVAIRNRATLVGNVCNASPAADTAPALLVYGASAVIAGPTGQRTVALTDFFVGPGETLCGRDEIVTRVDVPLPEPAHRSAFQRLTRRRGVDLATVSVAAGVDESGQITLGLGCVGPTPLLTQASAPVDPTDRAATSSAIADLVSIATPISDVRAASDYRTAMVQVLAERAVDAALGAVP